MQWCMFSGFSFKFHVNGNIFVPGEAAVKKDLIPYQVKKDNEIMVFVTESSKNVMSLADCICEIAKNKGVMEFTMYDHDLKPMPKDHCFVCCVELYHSAVELSCFAQSASHEFVCRMMERPSFSGTRCNHT